LELEYRAISDAAENLGGVPGIRELLPDSGSTCIKKRLLKISHKSSFKNISLIRLAF
jgi:hypothetical protein